MGVKYQTLRKLIDCRLIRGDGQKHKHNANPLFCTELGNTAAENLERICKALPYKECSPDDTNDSLITIYLLPQREW